MDVRPVRGSQRNFPVWTGTDLHPGNLREFKEIMYRSARLTPADAQLECLLADIPKRICVKMCKDCESATGPEGPVKLSAKTLKRLVAGVGFEPDLQVMSLTSYRTAPPRAKEFWLRALLRIADRRGLAMKSWICRRLVDLVC